MKFDTFAVPFTDDRRMIYAKEYLEKNSYRCVSSVGEADFVVLPLPVKKEMLSGLDGKTVFLGKGDFPGTFDYYKNENFVMKNAILTAEGAVALAEEATDISLYRSKILICGFGRIGCALASVLSGYGTDITVCSRSEVSKTKAIFAGAKHITLEQLVNKNDYDIVFNTIPHMIFTAKELKALKSEAVIIDLASFPGGVDTLMASSLGLRLVDGKGIPKRYAVKTAGYLIGEAITEMIEEEIS